MFVMPRSYQAYASLWAFRRFEIITTTGPESDQQSTPAETQATALTELLQVHAFALSVAKATSLPSTLPADVKADPAARDDALINAVLKVQVVAQAYNLFVITYTNSNPEVAQRVVQAVIQNFGLQSQGFSYIEAQPLLAGLQTQLAKAQQGLPPRRQPTILAGWRPAISCYLQGPIVLHTQAVRRPPALHFTPRGATHFGETNPRYRGATGQTPQVPAGDTQDA